MSLARIMAIHLFAVFASELGDASMNKQGYTDVISRQAPIGEEHLWHSYYYSQAVA